MYMYHRLYDYNQITPIWCQAITWTNVDLLSIGPLGTNFSEILIEVQTFSLKKMHLKMLSVKGRPFCLSLNELQSGLCFIANAMPYAAQWDIQKLWFVCVKMGFYIFQIC